MPFLKVLFYCNIKLTVLISILNKLHWYLLISTASTLRLLLTVLPAVLMKSGFNDAAQATNQKAA